MKHILVVEDGAEYSETLSRFLGHRFLFTRAGDGPEALERLAAGGFDAVFLDMCFDRIRDERLFGDLGEAAERFNGDRARGRAFLQEQQGLYVLAALRDAGHPVPVLLSHDFAGEPRRFERLRARYAPLDHLPDVTSPAVIEARLAALTGA